MRRAASFALALLFGASGCGAPTLSQDGQFVFTEPGGRRGASVITANGVQFMDATELPHSIERKSASEPWRAPTGFLLPSDGVWRETSKPVPIQGPGLAVVLRSSDALVPSWGGEILLRVDAIVPATAFPAAAASVRAPIHVAIVLDGHDANAARLASVALDDLGEHDRIALVDAGSGGAKGVVARTVVPLVPGTNKTLVAAAIERLITSPAAGGRDLTGALAIARRFVGPAPSDTIPTILVLSDASAAMGTSLDHEVREIVNQGLRLTAIGAPDNVKPGTLAQLGPDVMAGGSITEREDAVARAVPQPGDVVLNDVTLSIASVPAPSRLLELSGGSAALSLDHDRFELGDLYAGEARTEVARIAVPEWVPGEPLELKVTATYMDKASGKPLNAEATIHCRYSDDVEAIASSRHGDVIAYASGLAMVRRLNRAFAGSRVDGIGGLREVVAWQARSLETLAKVSGDPALGEQAEVLTALLGAIRD